MESRPTPHELKTRYSADVRRVGLRSTYEVHIRGDALPSDAEVIAMCGETRATVRRATGPDGRPVYLVRAQR